ncbi:MAG: AAA domain-containing protein, partial [Maioricimonas sp. JB049]
AEAMRREHATRFMPQAFDRDSRTLVQEAAGFESVWKRWFGGFKAFRARVRDLYVDQPPQATNEFLADFRALQDYHKAAAAPRRFEDEMPDALVTGPAGSTDWRQILSGLDAVEHLCGMITGSDAVRIRLCTDGTIRREELGNAARQLDEATNELAHLLATLEECIDLSVIGADAIPRDNANMPQIAAWGLEVAARVNQRLADLEDIAAQLREDHDVEITQLNEHRGVCADLRKAGEAERRASGILEEYDIRHESGPDPEHVAAARWLKETLDRCHGEIPPASAAVAGSDEVRELVTESLEMIRTTLDDEFLESWEFLRKQVFPIRKPVSVGITIVLEPFDRLAEWFRRMLEALPELNAWMRYCESRAALESLGLEGVLQEVLQGDYPLAAAWPAFQARFYRQWLDRVYGEDSVLRNFNADDHERNLEEFRDLDRRSIDAGHCRIRSRLLSDPHRPHAEGIDIPHSSELGVLLHECNKKKRHLPLRELFNKIPSVLMRLKPCLMMSPLAVSTYLQNPELVFDLVIFDEASQVRPFDAVGAIYRGRQLVVAGDQKQLPPTSFFDRMGSEEDEAAADDDGIVMRDYESILDVCLSLQVPRKRLRWHYRSKREPLIAFSNHYFYNNELVTFPSVFDVDGQTAVSHVYVSDGCWKSGGGGGLNEIEAQRTAELVFEHFRNSPHKSLGVITFNQRQQLAVDDCLQELRRSHPDCEPYFDTDRPEHLFIKNLENVQGDERDVILMSLGYGFDQHGKFHRRFGPLAREGGERRLNVAVTRAREQITLVSSIRSHDLDVSGLLHAGPKLLKAYLEYAERGVEALGAQTDVAPDAEFDSPFEQEVYDALRSKGLQVHTQVGCGGYRIDLAIVHPERPGSYVLGVECDGVTYHSSRTARDRDRLRQEVLENGLGWKIVRVWSTDWIANPHGQVQRVLAAFQHAISSGDTTPVQQAPAGDDVDLAPRYIPRTSGDGPRPAFSAIEEVPETYLTSRLQEIARRLGTTQRDDLIRSVARDLGFARTGNRIRQRIDECLHAQIADRVLTEDADGRVGIAADPDS